MIELNLNVIKQFQIKGVLQNKYNPIYSIYQEGEDKLQKFNVSEIFQQYPTEIDIQDSYDGSVNLIFNDSYNKTLLINSRFSVLDDNKYKIINRIGEKQSNLYTKSELLSQASLYKIYQGFPEIKLSSVKDGGNLKVGLYVFYIKYSDADGNQTTIAAESSIIPCYSGSGSRIDGLYENYNSHKQITLDISNIDTQFNYINIYYSKSSSDKFSLTNTTIYQITNPYPILENQSEKRIIITGDENVIEITREQLNTDFSITNSVKSISKCGNRLFLGNINQYSIDYEELSDISLRIYPTLQEETCYFQTSADDIYNNVGYWNEEFYRFGIVYIYNNNTLSPVFNILGINDLTDIDINIYNASDEYSWSLYKDRSYKILDPKGVTRNYLKYNHSNFSLELDSKLNSKGVSRINLKEQKQTTIKIKFVIPPQVLYRLKTLGIIGYYFVRQKRIPTILAQGLCVPHAANIGCPTTQGGTVQCVTNGGSFSDNKGGAINESLIGSYVSVGQSSNACCCICPDYTVRQAFYNTIFTGDTFKIKVLGEKFDFYHTNNLIDAKIVAVKEDTPAIVLYSDRGEEFKFSSRMGEAADATKFSYDLANRSTLIKVLNVNQQNSAVPVFRGIVSPFLGIQTTRARTLLSGRYINIYIPGYDIENLQEYFSIRYQDDSPYFAISSRYELSNQLKEITLEDNEFKLPSTNNLIKNICARGDCYNYYFKQRLWRNFQDPSAPNNDTCITLEGYHKYRYDDDKGGFYGANEINRGDINAVKLGYWIDCYAHSTNNLNIRSTDRTHPEETALTGRFRSFYAITGADISGNNKIPESQFINEGFSQSLGQRVNFLQAEVPYIKSDFQNRIMYSDIYVNDAYQNGFRIFRQGNFVDYSSNYGGITRIMEYQGNLAIIFEHGIGIAQVGQNESSVLSETPLIVSNQYGSLWHDSIVQTQDCIYGVDTDAKKIWRLRGQELTIISEFNIESYLQKNINLNQHDVIPSYDFKRVVTHYNAAKKDVIFTFYHRGESDYDELNENNKVIQWSLCWNEYLQKWQTFYSWMPFLSENINNIFFTLAYDNPYIWKHGNAGNYRYQDKLLPTFWYGKQHPFEFEFVVRADISTHKIFNNLEIISNNAEPESFHYEISPDCYDFAEDLYNMYFRQEHTKFFEREYNYRVLGKVKKIKYDEDVINNEELQTGIEQFVIEPRGELTQSGYYNKRSTLLPLKYYVRDTDENLIEDYYHETTSPSKDFKNLSGTEIVSTSDGLKLQEHCIAADMRKVGRLRGNMYFQENRWFIQINPINFCQRNEHKSSWRMVDNHWYPPIILQERLPKDWNVQGIVLDSKSPYLLKQTAIELDNWTNRQEIKLKDKYMKVKIRYTGNKLAIINSVITMYSEI